MRNSLSFAHSIAALALASCVASPATSPETRADSDDTQEDLVATKASTSSCADQAAVLAVLLAAAQSCNVAAANPTQCASWVPSVTGCEQPVAGAGTEATRAYLAAFEQYAASCPLPDIACVDPSTLATDCTQAADIDSLVGRCTIVKGP